MEVAEGPALVALPSPLPAWGPALCDVVAWSGDLSPPRARAADPARARAPATRGSALKGAAARSAAARGEGPSTSEPAGAERSYCLVVVGEDGRSPRLCPEGGHIVEDFTHLLASGGFLPAPGPAAPAPAPAAPAPAPAPKREKPPAGKPTARSALPTYRKGGPCDHCRCTESPQWRRGPSHKPTLCNACGTRYRRTNVLGPAKRGPPMKKPRHSANKLKVKAEAKGRVILAMA